MVFPPTAQVPSHLADHHENVVYSVSSKVKSFYAAQKPYRIYHGSTNSTRESKFTRDNIVDTSELSHVLQIDVEEKTVLVEPNVPLDSLVDATLQLGLVPPVVMELPGITVGGGFAGTSAESSSFKHGIFDRAVIWFEMVLPNGQVVSASKEDKSDLFYGAASSFGTLGITTALKVKLVDAHAFVEMRYIPVASMDDALKEMGLAAEDPTVDFLDGILFSATSGAIIVGKMSNKIDPNASVQRFLRARDPWYYLHVQSTIKKHASSNSPIIVATPIKDYFFRYDRGGFWVGKYAYAYFLTPFNRVTRYLLNPFMKTRVMFHALHKSGFARMYTVQDVAVPFGPAAVNFLDYLQHEFGHWPLWLCPLKYDGNPPLFHRGLLNGEIKEMDREQICEPNRDGVQQNPSMLLNFGVWGPGPTNRRAFARFNRELEQKVHALGGQKCLYAHAYYTEDEFWSIYDKSKYDALREKYHAQYLPSVYDKVKVDVEAEEREANKTWKDKIANRVFWRIWPLAGVYGVLHTIIKSDYLIAKEPTRKRFSRKHTDEKHTKPAA